jgi:hypothetical protein
MNVLRFLGVPQYPGRGIHYRFAVIIDQNLETHLRHCFTLKTSSHAQLGYAAIGTPAIIEGPDDIPFTTKFAFF